MNQGLVVGRYTAKTNDIIVINTFNNNNKTVQIPIKLSSNILKHVEEYCNFDDVMGVKYHLESDDNLNVTFVADKVTFLSSKTAGKEVGGEKDGTI